MNKFFSTFFWLIATLKFGMSPILFELTIFWLFDIDIVATLENRFKVSFLFILPSSFKTIWHCIANDLKVFIHIKMEKKNVSIFFSLTSFDRHFWPLYANSSSFFRKLTLSILKIQYVKESRNLWFWWFIVYDFCFVRKVQLFEIVRHNPF